MSNEELDRMTFKIPDLTIFLLTGAWPGQIEAGIEYKPSAHIRRYTHE